jgi:glycerate kinase
MHVVVAPDKFKGSLTAAEVAARIAAGIRAVAPDATVDEVPVADGGDGTVDAALAAGYERIPVRAEGPTRAAVEAAFAMRDGVAVVEMANVSGLRLLAHGHARHRRQREHGRRGRTGPGAGSSAARRREQGPAQGRHGPRALERLDLSGLHPGVRETRFIVASDVDNPLIGGNGAAAVYGPQKGASETDVAVLDAALARWADVVDAAIGGHGRALRDRPGAGAAGGVGYAAMAVLDAELRPGIELVLDLVGFADRLDGADLVITGEGSLDEQTLSGKAPAGVAAAAADADVPVVAASGRLTLSQDQLHAAGIRQAYALTDIESDVSRCIADAGPLLQELAGRLARNWLVGPAAGRPSGAALRS